MELSIFIAKIIAVLYLSAAVNFLTGGVDFKKMFDGFASNPAITFLSGLVGLILGFFLIEYHNIWEGEWWVIIITIIGYIAVAKGIMFIAFPKAIKLFEPWYKGKRMQAWGYLALAVGLVFGYYGFIA